MNGWESLFGFSSRTIVVRTVLGLHVPTMVYFITWMQLTEFANFQLPCLSLCLSSFPCADGAREKFYERLKVKVLVPL